MRKLRESLTKNGLRYRLKQRTDYVAMYEVLAIYSDTVSHIEVFRIPVTKPDKYLDENRERLPNNAEFGINNDSKAFGGANKHEQAEDWYHHLLRKTSVRCLG